MAEIMVETGEPRLSVVRNVLVFESQSFPIFYIFVSSYPISCYVFFLFLHLLHATYLDHGNSYIETFSPPLLILLWSPSSCGFLSLATVTANTPSTSACE